MSGQNKTLAEIVAMLRANARGERFDAFSFSSLADWIEAAAKREIPQPDPCWKDICAACKDGDIEPKFCAYYGEPNGCNSPIYGEHPKSAPVGDAAAMRKALDNSNGLLEELALMGEWGESAREQIAENNAALSAPPPTGKWKSGRKYEYEYAYCSECGRMQWAGWDTHKQAEEDIESFAGDYRFCPGCGAKMEGGIYVK